MGGTCSRSVSTRRRDRKHMQTLVRIPEGQDKIMDVGVDGKVI